MTDLTLRQQLDEAEARAAMLRRQIETGRCEDVGHRWRSVGGRNAGCCSTCACSVPVLECSHCGICDYGDNDEARGILEACAARDE